MLVLAANLTLDRTLRMSRLEPGHVQRPRTAVVSAGGKSVNVCRSARALGGAARLIANLPGRLGEHAGDLLVDEGHDVRRVPTGGQIRSAIVIIEDGGRVTVLNEPGPDLSAADLAAVLDAVRAEATGHRVATASGSLPPSAPSDTYGRFVDLVRRAGGYAVVDAAREALRDCLGHAPDLVTPNLAEGLVALGDRVDEAVEPPADGVRQIAAETAQRLRERGARAALVTAGRYGVAGADGDGCFWVSAPPVDEVNPIGAGDAFLGALGVALDAGGGLREATLLAVAAGSASVAHPVAGVHDPRLTARLRAGLGWQAA